MAEAAAAFYAIESAVEGAVLGGLALSQATAPLHIRLQKIRSPAVSLSRTNASASIIKSRLYLVGGDSSDAEGLNDKAISVVTLPADYGSSKQQGREPLDVDYQNVTLTLDTDRPLQGQSLNHTGTSPCLQRSAHATATIEDKIYIFGGRPNKGHAGQEHLLTDVVLIDTARNTFKILPSSDSGDGQPGPRMSPSMGSSIHPAPSSVTGPADSPTIDAYGTLFLHGGYNEKQDPLHDTWSFDVGTRRWYRLPSVPEEVILSHDQSGKIFYTSERLWYVNTRATAYLDLAESTEQAASPIGAATDSSNGRIGTGQWIVVCPRADEPIEKLTPIIPALSSIHLLSTGAGRQYLTTVPQTGLADAATFQLESESMTLTSVKDTIRDSKVMPSSWQSGKHQWAKCETVEADKVDGPLPLPSSDLHGFATALWTEHKDRLIVWGGADGDGKMIEEGWVLTFS